MSRKQATSSAARGALAMLTGPASGAARTGGDGAASTVGEHPRLISFEQAQQIYGIPRQTWEFWRGILRGIPRGVRYDRELALCMLRVGRKWMVDSHAVDRVLARRLDPATPRKSRVVEA